MSGKTNGVARHVSECRHKVYGEGSGGRSRTPAGPGQVPGKGSRGRSPTGAPEILCFCYAKILCFCYAKIALN